MTRILTAITLLTLVAVVVAPALSQEATGYKLRRVFKVNDIRRYKMVMDMNGEMRMGEQTMPLNMQMVMVTREKVAGIKDGKATVHTTIEDMKMFMNGQEFGAPMMPNMSNVTITTVLDDRNRVLEVKGLEALAAGNPGLGGMNFGSGYNTPSPFPEGEVKPGDTWEVEVPVPNAKDFVLRARQTFVAVEKVGGVDAARIKTEMEIPYEKLMAAMAQQMPAGTPAMSGVMKVVSHTYFDLATGNILKMDGDVAMDLQMTGNNPQMPQNMQMNMTAKMTLTQLKESAPAAK